MSESKWSVVDLNSKVERLEHSGEQQSEFSNLGGHSPKSVGGDKNVKIEILLQIERR